MTGNDRGKQSQQYTNPRNHWFPQRSLLLLVSDHHQSDPHPRGPGSLPLRATSAPSVPQSVPRPCATELNAPLGESASHLRQRTPPGRSPSRQNRSTKGKDLGNVSTPESGRTRSPRRQLTPTKTHIEDIGRDMGRKLRKRSSRHTQSLEVAEQHHPAAAVIPPLHLFEALRRITASQPLHGRARVAGGDPAGVVRRVDAGSPSRRLMGHWHGHCDSRTNESKGVAVGVMQRSVDLPGRLGWRPHARMLEPTEGVEPTTGKLAR